MEMFQELKQPTIPTETSNKVSLQHHYKQDALEQYQRRDNIKIFGLEGSEDENEGELEEKWSVWPKKLEW